MKWCFVLIQTFMEQIQFCFEKSFYFPHKNLCMHLRYLSCGSRVPVSYVPSPTCLIFLRGTQMELDHIGVHLVQHQTSLYPKLYSLRSIVPPEEQLLQSSLIFLLGLIRRWAPAQLHYCSINAVGGQVGTEHSSSW